MKYIKTISFLHIVTTLFLGGCANTPQPEGKTPAEVLYKEALENTKKERYLLAIEKINAIKSQYPYSFFATHAELLQADIFFSQGNYVESAAAYILFRDLHPKHEKLSYVIWKTAESFFYQLPSSFDRDLSPAQEAIKYYKEVITHFPGSDYETLSREKIKMIEEMLMKKELYIADFYFKTGVFDSARYRYLDILKKYEEREIRDLSMLRIVESSIHLNEFVECQNYSKEFSDLISRKGQKKLKNLSKQCENKNELKNEEN